MPTAIEIFKFLPKTNCRKCGFPTCLAFAMQLASSKVKLADCPYVSDEAKAKLEASSAPPMRLITIGAGENKVELGEETELYRHEKKFFHPTRYAVVISDAASDEDVTGKLLRIASLHFERVGQVLRMDMVGVRNDSGDAAKFVSVVKRIASSAGLPLVLISDSPDAMKAAVAEIRDQRPLLYAATSSNAEAMAAVAKEAKCPLVVKDRNLGSLASLVEKVKASGVEDMMLDHEPENLQQLLEKNTIVRKNAVKKTFRGLGYPMVTNAMGDQKALLKALVSTMKYGGVVLLDDLDPAHAVPLFVLRQNIYTDPQVPIQVKAGLYPIGEPGEGAPIIFTTNFSLTYFTVAADIEKSKVPAWLLVVDTEGLSVLTAFSAGKLTAETVTEALRETGAGDKSKRDLLIIPGMVSRMSGKLGEATGMKVVVGPKESSGLPKLLKSL